MELTQQEQTFLLLVEATVVENGGLLHTAGIDHHEWGIVKKWHESHFIRFGNAHHNDDQPATEGNRPPQTLWCEMSRAAWETARQVRQMATTT